MLLLSLWLRLWPLHALLALLCVRREKTSLRRERSLWSRAELAACKILGHNYGVSGALHGRLQS